MLKNTTNIKNTALISGMFLGLGLGFNPSAKAASKSWITTGGIQSKAAFLAASNVSATANASSYNASANASADVAFLSSPYMRVAYAAGSLSGTKTSIGLTGRVDFLGGNLWSYNQSLSATSHSASLPYISKTWKPPVAPVFIVGGVPVKVTPSVSVGIRGSLSGSLAPSTLTFTGTLAPATFDTSAGVTASAAAGIINVSGNLTVCRVSPNLTSSCSWKTRTASNIATVDYGTLGGSIDLLLGYKWLTYKLNIMNWAGFSGSTPLFAESVKF